LNDVRFLNPIDKGGFGMDSQWIDEFHHALRIAAGGEKTGYYSDFSGLSHLTKAYNDAYVYSGQYSEHRQKKNLVAMPIQVNIQVNNSWSSRKTTIKLVTACLGNAVADSLA